ncbi:MAG: hypothetical protein KDK36_10990 [Leptospiraceae bacterium]|nr:hypothetical protein [Leptospiraceae bacterium]
MADLTVADVPNVKALVGANVNVYQDGKKLFYMQNLKVDENYNQTDLYVLGNFFPATTMPMKFDGTITGKTWIIVDPSDEGRIKLPDLQEILVTTGMLVELRIASDDTPLMRAVVKLD